MNSSTPMSQGLLCRNSKKHVSRQRERQLIKERAEGPRPPCRGRCPSARPLARPCAICSSTKHTGGGGGTQKSQANEKVNCSWVLFGQHEQKPSGSHHLQQAAFSFSTLPAEAINSWDKHGAILLHRCFLLGRLDSSQ